MKGNSLIIAAFALLLGSCTNSKSNNEQSESNDTSSLSLQTFTELPTAIDGCACLFSENSTAFRAEEYLYADNMQEAGFVKIGDEIVQVTLEESENNSDLEILTRAQNDDLEIKLDLRKSDQTDYVGSYFGTLEVKTKDGRTYKKTVFGECGC